MNTRSSKRVSLLCLLSLAVPVVSTRAELWSYTGPIASNTFFSMAQSRVALGYRAVSLSCCTNRISAVWLRDYAPAELQLFVPYDGLQSNLLALHAKGYHPVNLAIYGQIPNESYLVSYVKDGRESSLFTRVSPSELTVLGSSTPGSRVAWLESNGVGQNASYAGVLSKDGLSEKLEVGLGKTAMEAKVLSYKEAGYRPVCIVGTAETSCVVYTANFVQESKRWTNCFGISPTEFIGFMTSLNAQTLRAEVITSSLAEDQQTYLMSVVAVEDLPPVWTITGNADPGLEEFDRVITNTMKSANCTRASFAISKDGRLMASRGYTHHPASVAPTQPTNMYRLASISKTITAVTVMGLVEAGKLQLEDKVENFLDLSDVTDWRWTNITVRHLLQHRGGWNRDTTFDPMFYDVNISTALRVPLPITKEHIFAYMKKQRLQANPGAVYSYSNFGYMLLGMIIEEITGQRYETFVRQNVLAPLGIYAARVGRTARSNQLPGEVEYEEGTSTYPSVLSTNREPATTPYGPYSLENCEALGAWVFNAEGLVRFASTFTDKSNCALLYSNTVDVMWAPAPQEPPLSGAYAYYGLGWVLRGTNQLPPFFALHDGGLPGTRTLMFRQSDGYCWAVLFNTRNEAGTDPVTILNPRTNIVNAIAGVTQWPTHDLFDIDADGLPDSYEMATFGSLTASNGRGDYDADGLPDSAEWIAMSNPVDATDGPRLNIQNNGGTTPFLQVANHGGRVYSVHAISALSQNWDASTVLAQFNGDGFTRTLQLDATDPSAFYRLAVSLRAKPVSPGLPTPKPSSAPTRAIADSSQVPLWPELSTELVPRARP